MTWFPIDRTYDEGVSEGERIRVRSVITVVCLGGQRLLVIKLMDCLNVIIISRPATRHHNREQGNIQS